MEIVNEEVDKRKSPFGDSFIFAGLPAGRQVY